MGKTRAQSLLELVGNLVESFARLATGGFMPATTTLTALGGALIVASLSCCRAPQWVRCRGWKA